MPSANQQPEYVNRVPEPSWWNMAIPIIIIVAGVGLGFLGVM